MELLYAIPVGYALSLFLKTKTPAEDTNGGGGQSGGGDTSNETAVPSRPTGVTAVILSSTSATVSFSAIASPNGTIESYTIRAYLNGNVVETLTITSSLSTRSYAILDLTPGATYTFSVVATNATGSSLESSQSSAITLTNVPSTPTGVSATKTTTSSATVTFNAVTSPNSTIQSYTIETFSNGSSVKTNTFTSSSSGFSSRSFIITQLMPGGSYTFTVIATNTVGPSSASAASTSIILDSNVVSNPPSTPRSVNATPTDSTNAQVTFDPPLNSNGTISAYTINIYNSSSVLVRAVQNLMPASSPSYLINNLTAGESYTFKAIAINENGSSSESAASPSITMPGGVTSNLPPTAPLSVQASIINSTSAQVTFDAPVNANGTIEDFTINVYDLNNSLVAYSNVYPENPLSYTIAELDPSGTYYFKVFATNEYGAGAESIKSANISLPPNDGPPSAPGQASAIALSNTSVSITFTTSAQENGTISGYIINIYDSNEFLIASSNLFNPATSPMTLTIYDLEPETEYIFAVKARNENGDSSIGAKSTSITMPPTFGFITAQCTAPFSSSKNQDFEYGAYSFSTYLTSVSSKYYVTVTEGSAIETMDMINISNTLSFTPNDNALFDYNNDSFVTDSYSYFIRNCSSQTLRIDPAVGSIEVSDTPNEIKTGEFGIISVITLTTPVSVSLDYTPPPPPAALSISNLIIISGANTSSQGITWSESGTVVDRSFSITDGGGSLSGSLSAGSATFENLQEGAQNDVEIILYDGVIGDAGTQSVSEIISLSFFNV